MLRSPCRSVSPSLFLRFGPGLALAIGAVILLWPRFRDGIQGDRPHIDRRHAQGAPAALAVPPAAPELGWILARHDALHLAPAQLDKLRRLKSRWDQDTGALREALERASAEFDREMASAQASKTSLQDLRERAGPVSELSRRLADLRRAYWGEAAQILTTAQRQEAEETWARGVTRGRQTSPAP